ncbi:MAG TPA: hypothetical protein VFJ82_06865 [Longimicrobium sp.]|nr:hypothetical protein [Longimicrobium sp.]
MSGAPEVADPPARDRRWTAERWARIAITIQFLALVRTLAEVYRLRWAAGGRLAFGQAQPFIAGGLIAAVFCWLAVTLYFFRRHRACVVVSIAMVAVMIAYKLYALGP